MNSRLCTPREMLRVILLQLSQGLCEFRKSPAPFKTKNDIPYLELHCIDLKKGKDPTNYVVLCPNCHRRLHVINDDQMNAVLQEKAAKHSLSSLFNEEQKELT